MFLAMRNSSAVTEFQLADWSVRSIHVRNRPVEVVCVDGEVLVTVEGDREDHIVLAGHSFRAQRRGHLVVSALRPSRVMVAEIGVVKDLAMPPRYPMFDLRKRSTIPGILLLALFAALALGFVGETWGSRGSARSAGEATLDGPRVVASPDLALCFCPDAVHAPGERR